MSTQQTGLTDAQILANLPIKSRILIGGRPEANFTKIDRGNWSIWDVETNSFIPLQANYVFPAGSQAFMQLDLVLQFTKNSDGMWWYTYQAAGNFPGLYSGRGQGGPTQGGSGHAGAGNTGVGNTSA